MSSPAKPFRRTFLAGGAASIAAVTLATGARADSSSAVAPASVELGAMPPGAVIVVDKAGTAYGLPGRWPATRPAVPPGVVVHWVGADPGPGAIMADGDFRYVESN